ncbi:hypothetical protein R0131_12570 [Clostridium sp. AL.422]|uniref:hypothetical protein n=1 Tax=Clostridium TaxID=1485 RepID=UPI00293DD904|nr:MULTISPECIES: hypothetical protein [unclassified Clostridium]MDV4151659.1 hypothetical protein [Clostridium sp. AL.422]
MVEIKPLDDVMLHFQWVFVAYIVLFIIVCINFYKAINIRNKLINNNAIRKVIQTSDLIVDILCGIAMYAGLMFQGVLADNNALNWTFWNDILIGISIVSLIIFILNIIVVVKKKESDY